MVIRDALPGELAAIGDLRVAAYHADGLLPQTSPYAPTLRALGADGKGDVLVAMDGPVLVGTIMLQFWPDSAEVMTQPGEAEIRALAVEPGARGRGIGRALLAEVMKRAGERGVRHLLLLARPETRAAQHLYAQAGFLRLPERDWSPHEGLTLLAFGRLLEGN